MGILCLLLTRVVIRLWGIRDILGPLGILLLHDVLGLFGPQGFLSPRGILGPLGPLGMLGLWGPQGLLGIYIKHVFLTTPLLFLTTFHVINHDFAAETRVFHQIMCIFTFFKLDNIFWKK